MARELFHEYKLYWHGQPGDPYSPSSLGLEDLRVAGIQHVDPGPKRGSDDNALKDGVAKFRESKVRDNATAGTVVVIISSDSDYAASIRAVNAAGMRSVIICNKHNAKPGYLSEADGVVDNWDIIAQSTIVPRSPSAPTSTLASARSPNTAVFEAVEGGESGSDTEY